MRGIASVLIAVGSFAGSASALVIDIDYTYDTSNYFGLNAAANASLLKAVADVQSVITSHFTAVTTDTFSGLGGDPSDPTKVKLDWYYQFLNPSDISSTITINTFSSQADHFRLYVGARVLPGDSVELGKGGGVALNYNLSVENGIGSEFAEGLNNAVAASNLGLVRNTGPLTITSESDTFDGVTVNYSVKTGAVAGFLSLNSVAPWNFDINTGPAPGQADFYSVAVHEIVHALGIGTTQTWQSMVSGTNWSGMNVGALTGGGVGIISAGGDHIAEGAPSFSIVTGLSQEAALDPTLQNGQRKTLTQLDLAFLRDIGYTTSAVPEPGTLALLGLAALGGLVMMRRRAS